MYLYWQGELALTANSHSRPQSRESEHMKFYPTVGKKQVYPVRLHFKAHSSPLQKSFKFRQML